MLHQVFCKHCVSWVLCVFEVPALCLELGYMCMRSNVKMKHSCAQDVSPCIRLDVCKHAAASRADGDVGVALMGNMLLLLSCR